MEIYRERINRVEFEAPDANTYVTAEYRFNGGTPNSLNVSTSDTEPEIRYVDVPYLPTEGKVEITWRFVSGGTQFTKTETYDVVTPYLSTRWIRRNLLPDLTDEQIREAEAAARYIVNAHTGQDFGKWTGSKTAVGRGENVLSLPARLISLDTVQAENALYGLWGNFDTTGDGWYLRAAGYSDGGGIKADISDGIVGVNGVIYYPYGQRHGAFAKDAKFTVTGTWGYESVPEPVTEAMKLLVNDYAGMDSAYRDRYLESLTSPDWRIQFHSGAFQRTGNVRADQLLSQYVLQRGWTVI